MSGLVISSVEDRILGVEFDKKLSKKHKAIIEELDELYVYNEDVEEWFKNPGGDTQIILLCPYFYKDNLEKIF